MLPFALWLAGSGPALSAEKNVAEISKGTALYRGCKAQVHLMDRPSLAQATTSEFLNGSYCVGYLNGYLSNLHPSDAICTHGEPVGILVRIYVAYMDANPGLLTEDRVLGLRMALREAFPCSIDDTPGSATTGAQRRL